MHLVLQIITVDLVIPCFRIVDVGILNILAVCWLSLLQEPLEQFGVAKGVHVRVHGQTGMVRRQDSASKD